MRDWFASDPARFDRFSIQAGPLLLDYSKNRITEETRRLLVQLAHECHLSDKINALFNGHPVNSTENRAATHTALRDRHLEALWINHTNVMPQIRAELDKMDAFVRQVREQTWLGATGKPIRDIVTIGLGGSHIGPLMACHALSHYASPHLRCHFISNIDGTHVQQVLQHVNPEETLFIISSKSFTTLETLTNTRSVQAWLRAKLGPVDMTPHFVAITAVPEEAKQLNIPDAQIFKIWDWVGGRYSIWSAIGLPVALLIGMDNFVAFLDGAHEMDQHFRATEFSENMPVMMALLGIWYINFFAASHHVITPYSHYLSYFRKYIQQADMESNGKITTHQGHQATYATAPVIWGEQGCDGQHSYHQLLHQGQHLIPVDFILVGQSDHFHAHQDILFASGLSQAKALMQGRSFEEALAETQAEGYSETEAIHLARHKVTPGNRPSNILFLDTITPRHLGALIAAYEHKIFVQSCIWDINSFDQWGIELGKQLLPDILASLQQELGGGVHDSSTAGLAGYYKKLRNLV